MLAVAQHPRAAAVRVVDVRVVGQRQARRVHGGQHGRADGPGHEVRLDGGVQRRGLGRGGDVLEDLVHQVEVGQRGLGVLAAQLDLAEVGSALEQHLPHALADVDPGALGAPIAQEAHRVDEVRRRAVNGAALGALAVVQRPEERLQVGQRDDLCLLSRVGASVGTARAAGRRVSGQVEVGVQGRGPARTSFRRLAVEALGRRPRRGRHPGHRGDELALAQEVDLLGGGDALAEQGIDGGEGGRQLEQALDRLEFGDRRLGVGDPRERGLGCSAR